MANAVRKICAKIGHGHQRYCFLGTTVPKTLDTGIVLEQHHLPVAQAELKASCSGSFHRSSQLLFGNVGRPVVGPRLRSAPPTNVFSTATRPDGVVRSGSNSDDSPSAQGLPTEEQLQTALNRLGEDLPKLFRQTLDYSMYHHQLVFENNIRGTKTVGLEYFMSTISFLRLMGHLKYAFVKFDILKITKHPEDGTIKMRWRIKGISGLKVFLKFWKFRLWNLEKVIQENVESWYDGFSVISVGSDGLIHKITVDKMQPDNDPIIEEKNSLAAKLALFLGLSPQLNNLDCLLAFDSEQTNELLKMVLMSLEDVI